MLAIPMVAYVVFLVLVVGVIAHYDSHMLGPRLLMGGEGASATLPTTNLVGLYNGTIDGGATYAIGAFTRGSDGLYIKSPSNPVLEAGSGWEADGVKDPWLIWDGTQYVMYYAGYLTTGPDAAFQIGRATATDIDGPWTKDGSNPVLTIGAGGQQDSNDVQAPVVLHRPSGVDGHPWWMWYIGSNGATSSPMLAHSDDGVSWTKDGAVDSAGGLFLDEDGYQQLYTNAGINHATFATPTGTYTDDPGNPLLERRGIVADTSPNPSANASAGATTITVASGDADGLEVGEPIIILDNNTGPEIGRVANIAATTITLDDPLLFSYSTGDGFTVRTMAYTIIDVRSFIRRRDGTFEAFGTTFRPTDGLTISGNTLWEGSLRYTAPAIDGPWSYDFDTGLVFPLTQLGDAWDSVSAENISAIHTP